MNYVKHREMLYKCYWDSFQIAIIQTVLNKIPNAKIVMAMSAPAGTTAEDWFASDNRIASCIAAAG
jgi:hypothetical protein